MVRQRGATLVEVIVGVVLGGMLLMAIAAVFRSAVSAQSRAVEQLPLAQAQSVADTFLRERIAEASCIARPEAGDSGNLVLGYTGRDCSGQAYAGQAGRMFAFCRDANDRLAYKEAPPGPVSELSGCETGDDGWIHLTPPSVAVGPQPGFPHLFSRSATRQNEVRMKLRFTAAGREQDWESHVLAQTAIR